MNSIGIYVDGFNLYYGARARCGRGTAGWRWLDIRRLVRDVIDARAEPGWAGSTIAKVIYCTATIDSVTNPAGYADQQTYLKALRASSSVDRIEYGNFVARVKVAPLATRDPITKRPVLVKPAWPVMVQDGGNPVPQAVFMVSYAYREEKGSDVNVASHLLLDVLGAHIDGAVVISNDSDLSLPVREARMRVPVGIMNPSPNYTAGKLEASAAVGAGGHWSTQLGAADFTGHQFPDPVTSLKGYVYSKPPGW
jgi:hypothetical protein